MMENETKDICYLLDHRKNKSLNLRGDEPLTFPTFLPCKVKTQHKHIALSDTCLSLHQ